jgi:antitoxin FitA
MPACRRMLLRQTGRVSDMSGHQSVPTDASGGRRPVPSILVRDLDQKTVERLKQRARLNRRSLQGEIRDILERAARTLTMDEARRLSERWQRRLAKRRFSDSAEAIREDRAAR